jgi:fatty-acyl-CoA synthase
MPQAVMADGCGSTEGANYGRRVVRHGDVPSTDNFVANPGVKIVDEQRKPVPTGTVGYIASPTPASGYFRDPEATRRAYYLDDGVQYVVPGDFGRDEGDGTITLLGRGSSVINTGGEKVFPEEVEHVLRRFPDIDDCLVVGTPHPRFGSAVAALVQPRAGARLDLDDILAEARNHLAGYKLPRRIVTGDVPRLPNGKPDYETARRLVLAEDERRGPEPPPHVV